MRILFVPCFKNNLTKKKVTKKDVNSQQMPLEIHNNQIIQRILTSFGRD